MGYSIEGMGTKSFIWKRSALGRFHSEKLGETKYMFNKPDQLILTLELKRMTDVTVSIHIRLVFDFV